MSESLSASEFANLCDVSTDLMRDWRRRGLLDGIGTTTSAGHWRYGYTDLINLILARHWLDVRLFDDVSAAIEFSRQILPWIDTKITRWDGSPFWHSYLIAQGEFDVAGDTRQLDVKPIESVELLPTIVRASPATANLIIDCEKLAAHVMSRVPEDVLDRLNINIGTK